MIVQKINSQIKDRYEMAYKYFSIMAVLNNINLVKRDLQLLAFSVSMDKSINAIKKDFVEEFGTTLPTIGNIITKLYKLNILKKNKKIVTINPLLKVDFEKDILLAINLKYNNGDKG